jgi:hypothetical protein
VAKVLLVIIPRLFRDERVAVFFIVAEIVRGGLSADIAVDAGIVHIVLAGDIIRMGVFLVGH